MCSTVRRDDNATRHKSWWLGGVGAGLHALRCRRSRATAAAIDAGTVILCNGIIVTLDVRAGIRCYREMTFLSVPDISRTMTRAMNAKRLLEQFMDLNAGDPGAPAAQADRRVRGASGLEGVAGGLAAGGLLGMLIGNKKARKKSGKLAGGVVGYGGAAALGALGYRAPQSARYRPFGQRPGAGGRDLPCIPTRHRS
jgi:hypothetical protein